MSREPGANSNGVAILYHLERDVTRLQVEMTDTRADVVTLRVDLAKLATRVSLYAALGAIVGGGAVSFLIRILAP